METDHAKQQAVNQLASIKEMVERLTHTKTCKGRGACDFFALGRFDDWYEYHNEEYASQEIMEDPLEVLVCSNWCTDSTNWEVSDYKILLSTGGGATRLRGRLHEGEPETAQLEYQDWGTPWIRLPLSQEDIDALLVYAQCFYFGE